MPNSRPSRAPKPTTHAPKSKAPRTVVITGGGGGLGLAMARRLLQDPIYRLILMGRNRNKLEAAAKELDPTEDRVMPVVCELTDSSQLKQAAEKIAGSFKGVYGIVHNAGVYPFGGVANTTEKQWESAMAVNLKAPFFLSQALLPLLKKSPEGGRILHISSTAGILPNHFALAYSVAKAALIQLTKTMAKELGKDNITVNCICPGIVKTELHEAYHQSPSELEEFYAKRGASLPLGRVGEAGDVAGLANFLLSDEAAWITGDVMVVDGGRLLV